MENVSTAPVKLKKATGPQLLDAHDELAIEEPLEIQIIYGNKTNRTEKTISITMRTPGNDEELAEVFFLPKALLKTKTR